MIFVRDKIYPFINDKSTAGQDLLNLFFITFNKYVGKSDKNQAFTPDHITDFMSQLCCVNRNTVVLDMTCGSGSFLVRAMTQALADCHTKKEEDEVKRSHIYGVEYDELVYGLATTNMLIHGDGNSNIVLGSCFEKVPRFIADGVKFDVVLMNPPYNAMATQVPTEFSDTWGKSKQDPSNGLYFVRFVLDQMNKHGMSGKLAVLLPMACAIGSKNRVIRQMKRDVLKNNALDTVFSLPKDVFYPGSSTCTCCMLFDVGVPHESAGRETFFAYCKEDGFKTRKKLGRVEQMDERGDSLWDEIEKGWLLAYRNRDVIPGFSARRMINGDDEWLCEAYMETDYSTLSHEDFQQTVNDYLAHLVKTGKWHWIESYIDSLRSEPAGKDGETAPYTTALDTGSWKTFAYPEVFDIRNGFYNKKPEHIEKGRIPFLGAVNGNNGVTEYYTYEEIETSTKTGDGSNSPMGQKLFPSNAVCVTNNGSVGFAYFQPARFTCSHDVTPLYRKNGDFNVYTGLFVAR